MDVMGYEIQWPALVYPITLISKNGYLKTPDAPLERAPRHANRIGMMCKSMSHSARNIKSEDIMLRCHNGREIHEEIILRTSMIIDESNAIYMCCMYIHPSYLDVLPRTVPVESVGIPARSRAHPNALQDA